MFYFISTYGTSLDDYECFSNICTPKCHVVVSTDWAALMFIDQNNHDIVFWTVLYWSHFFEVRTPKSRNSENIMDQEKEKSKEKGLLANSDVK